MVFTLRDGYDKSKNPREFLCRFMEIHEAQTLGNERVKIKARDGTLRDVKVNGMARTWKRDKNRVAVPVKYGMYEYTTFTNQYDGTVGNGVASLVVVLTDEEARRWYETGTTEEVTR